MFFCRLITTSLEGAIRLVSTVEMRRARSAQSSMVFAHNLSSVRGSRLEYQVF